MAQYAVRKATLTSNGSGVASAQIDNIFGRLHEVIVVPAAGLSNAWDMYITRIAGDVAETFYSNTSMNTVGQGNIYHYPRVQVVKTSAAAVTAASNENDLAVILGSVSITGANMGDTQSATVVLIVEVD
jgi:hypothetical protein